MVTYSDTENVEGAYHSQIPRGILPVKQRNPGTSCMDEYYTTLGHKKQNTCGPQMHWELSKMEAKNK